MLSLRTTRPIVAVSFCGLGFGLRDGLKRCLRGMAGEPANFMHTSHVQRPCSTDGGCRRRTGCGIVLHRGTAVISGDVATYRETV